MLGIKPTGRQESHDGTVSLATATLAVAVECSFLLALGAAAPAAHDADLKVISTVARTPTLDELTPKYESSSGNKLMLVYSTIADLKKRIDAGETADVMILSRPFLDGLQSQGKVAQGSIVHVGSSYVAIGVRTGVPKPDISTAEKLKAALLAAKSISYADPAKGGASGYFAKVIDRLGIADQMKSKTVLVPGAEAGDLVAKGEVEMGVAQASEIAAVPGLRWSALCPVI
jgi:molybdate transport system substrate-binding protein